MCEVCDIRKKLKLTNEELEFRLEQYQKEKRFGKESEATNARRQAFYALEQLFKQLDDHHEAMLRRESESEPSGLGETLANLFGQKLN